MQSAAEIHFMCSPPDMFGKVWPHVGPILLRGIRSVDNAGVLECIDMLRSGEALLWLVTRGPPAAGDFLGCFCTQLYERDGRRYLGMFAAAGISLREWVPQASKRMDEYAKAEGCDAMRIRSRKGWEKLLTDAAVVGRDADRVELERAVA